MSNIVIDDNLRTMTIPTDIVLLGVESDDDVNKIPFVMPKEYCGYDLTTFEARINYMNANGDGDIYVVEDLAVDEEDPTKMKFTWLVGRNACMYKGNTQFIVCLKKFAADDTGTVVQEFNTTVYSLPVLQGLETTEAVEQQNADIIEYILQRIQDAGMIDPDDYYTKDEVDALIPTELPNPEALTINGQSYDGSEAVEITIEASNEVIATASGKLIHVVDAVAGEVKTLSLYDAYDTELSSGEIAVTNKNLFRIDQLADHVVSKGISFDKNEDGSITVSGTSTGTNAMTTCDLDRNMFIIGQAYTLSTSKTVGYCYVQLILTYIDGTVDYMIAMNSSRSFTIEKEVSSCVASVQLTNSGVTVDDEVVYPMLEVGSSASKFTDNVYSTLTYDGTTMPVLPAAISNVWANDDVVANMVMTYSASTILNEIDNYAEANLKSNDNSTLVALYDGVGTVMLGEDVTDPAAIPLSVEVDDTLSIAGMAADAKATGDAIGDVDDIIDSLYPVAEVSGNPAIFDCDLTKPLVECTISFLASQEGTGDPSSTNVRNIVGVDDITLTVNENDVVIDLDGTRYGGYVDAVTGVMHCTWTAVDMANLTWNSTDAGDFIRWRCTEIKDYKSISLYVIPTNVMVEQFILTSYGGQLFSEGVGKFRITNGNMYAGTADINTKPQGLLAYELTEPFDIQLMPTQINTIVGNNSIECDADDLTIKYKESIQKYIDDKIAETQALTLTT